MFSKVRSVRRPSPAMVVAFIALLVAGGGAAVAAIPDSDDAEIHGCYTTRTGALRVIDAEAGETCNASKETALVWNQEGPQGDPGTPGTPGTPGSAGASALTGLVTAPTWQEGETRRYAEPNGSSTTVESPFEVSHLSPNSTIVARDLAVFAEGHLSVSAGLITFTLMDDGSPTSVQCGKPFTPAPTQGPLTCNSGAATATISPGSELTLQIRTQPPNPASPEQVRLFFPVRFGWRAATP